MQSYVAHILGPTGGVVDVRRFDCASDQEAIERARNFVPTLGLELRCMDRLVIRLSAKSLTFASPLLSQH